MSTSFLLFVCITHWEGGIGPHSLFPIIVVSTEEGVMCLPLSHYLCASLIGKGE